MAIGEEVTKQLSTTRPDTDLTEQLQAFFERAGAELESDPNFHQRYLLDFTVTRLEDVHAHVNLGVHVTGALDDLEQQETFLQAARRGIVLKAVYIELADASLSSGGLLVAFGACLAFLFDRRYTQLKATGIRIQEDCSFHFFDLEENVERLQRMSFDDEFDIGEDLEGRVIAYFTDKGFGFIQTDEERKFFFHIANVVDDELRARLPAYVPGEIIPVDFQYGGNDGKKYPKAINVSLPEDLPTNGR
jgi:cold shock CspA family protein